MKIPAPVPHRIKADVLPPFAYCPECGMQAQILRENGRWKVAGCRHARPEPEREKTEGGWFIYYVIFDPDLE